jgi:hypothetical protein
MTRLTLTLLGGFQARHGDGPVLALPVKAKTLGRTAGGRLA